MGVDRFEVRGHVCCRLHRVAQAVNGHHYRRPFHVLGCWSRQFGPEGLEDGPGDVGITGAEVGKAVEGDVGLEGNGEGVFVGDLQLREDGRVGSLNLGKEVGHVVPLDVLRWLGVGEGAVFCVAFCEIDSFRHLLALA